MPDVTVDEVFSNGHWTGLWNRDVKKQPMRRKLLSAETTCPSRLFTEPCEHGIPNSTSTTSVFSAEDLYLLGARIPALKTKRPNSDMLNALARFDETLLGSIIYLLDTLAVSFYHGSLLHNSFSSFCNFHLFGVWHDLSDSTIII